eukprot:782867-Pyramimonas_sp.AAC.1
MRACLAALSKRFRNPARALQKICPISEGLFALQVCDTTKWTQPSGKENLSRTYFVELYGIDELEEFRRGVVKLVTRRASLSKLLLEA